MPATAVALNQMTERKNARHVYHNIFESFFFFRKRASLRKCKKRLNNN